MRMYGMIRNCIKIVLPRDKFVENNQKYKDAF